MKPFDHDDPANAAGTQLRQPPHMSRTPLLPCTGMAGQGTGAVGRRDLRGLEDPADAGKRPHDGTNRPSLWTRIKRAFQYGSQGGETN